MNRCRAFAVASICLVGCARDEPPTPSAPAASSSPTTHASAAPADAATPIASRSSWSGHYTAIVGSLTVPEWTGVRFRGEDASVGLGDGEMNVTIGADDRASGSLDGALGATKIEGSLHADDFGATLVPDDLRQGFSGTAIGSRSGDHIAGTMRLSLPTGNVVREATFTLDRKR